MGIHADSWIWRMALEEGMIAPFADGQVRKGEEGENVIRYDRLART